MLQIRNSKFNKKKKNKEQKKPVKLKQKYNYYLKFIQFTIIDIYYINKIKVKMEIRKYKSFKFRIKGGRMMKSRGNLQNDKTLGAVHTHTHTHTHT